MTNQSTPVQENYEFKTEVHQLLDLVINSLYSHKDIFMRELISNASDAIDHIRYQSLTQPDMAENDTHWKIKIIPDEKANTLTISDNGIGMTHDEIIQNLGTIAKSGTREFLNTIKENKGDVNMIGRFGVGFYSSFMVADKVEVVTRTSKGKAHKWSADGPGGFHLEETEKTGRGTDIILHLKKESHDYLQEYEIRGVVKKYSDFIEFPIVMDVEREAPPQKPEDKAGETPEPEKKIVEETLNSRKALWAKAKNQIKPEEYIEFYRHIAHDFNDPLETIHYQAEGTIEFKALLYIPKQAPFDLFMRDADKGIHLYINRVFIMNDAKTLLPNYLRFVKGVVDASDLPLNVSREILQQDANLEKIRKNLVKKILGTLQTMRVQEYDKYLTFYKAFGQVLKEGLHFDPGNKDAIAELLLFESTKAEKENNRSLDAYLQDMPETQKSIYYILAEDRHAALASPHLEVFKSKNIEVLIMTETIDEWIVQSLVEYKQKPLKSVGKGELDLDESEKQKLEEENREKKVEYHDLVELMKTKLASEIKEVRFSQRLTDSPACLVLDEMGMSKHMQELFKAAGQEMPPQKNILEINAKHALIEKMNSLFRADKDSPELSDYIDLLYDQTLLTAGYKIKDPAGFSRRVTKLMVKEGH